MQFQCILNIFLSSFSGVSNRRQYRPRCPEKGTLLKPALVIAIPPFWFSLAIIDLVLKSTTSQSNVYFISVNDCSQDQEVLNLLKHVAELAEKERPRRYAFISKFYLWLPRGRPYIYFLCLLIGICRFIHRNFIV